MISQRWEWNWPWRKDGKYEDLTSRWTNESAMKKNMKKYLKRSTNYIYKPNTWVCLDDNKPYKSTWSYYRCLLSYSLLSFPMLRQPPRGSIVCEAPSPCPSRVPGCLRLGQKYRGIDGSKVGRKHVASGCLRDGTFIMKIMGPLGLVLIGFHFVWLVMPTSWWTWPFMTVFSMRGQWSLLMVDPGMGEYSSAWPVIWYQIPAS